MREKGTKKGGPRNRRTDLATKRISSSSRSRSARAVASDRTGLYMLKKCSGTRNEKACASIAKAMLSQLKAMSREMRRTPKIDVEILQAAKERLCGRRGESLEEFICQACAIVVCRGASENGGERG